MSPKRFPKSPRDEIVQLIARRKSVDFVSDEAQFSPNRTNCDGDL
jgi:hypothetical protein